MTIQLPPLPAPLPGIYDFLSSNQLGDLGTHLAQLVKLLKAGLEDARDVFAGDGQDARSAPAVRLLVVQPDAIRIHSSVNADFVRFIQEFLDRRVGDANV